MKLKGSLTTPTCGRFYGKKLNLVVLSQLVGFFNSLLLLVLGGKRHKFVELKFGRFEIYSDLWQESRYCFLP